MNGEIRTWYLLGVEETENLAAGEVKVGDKVRSPISTSPSHQSHRNIKARLSFIFVTYIAVLAGKRQGGDKRGKGREG